MASDTGSRTLGWCRAAMAGATRINSVLGVLSMQVQGGLAHIRIGRTQDTEPAYADSSARLIARDRGLRATSTSSVPSAYRGTQSDNNRLISELRTHAGSA